MTSDPHHLERFVAAQEGVHEQALGELQRGRKTSHWMWFVFPQIDGLGSSPLAHFYAIRNLDEARAYLKHPVLGPRLEACCHALLSVEGKTATQILEFPDDLKLRSCVTLFSAIAPADSVFSRVLAKYYGGTPDPRTLELLAASA